MSARKVDWWMPQMTGKESAVIEQVLDSNFLNDGEFTTRFERQIAARVGARHVVAVPSGTAAMFASLAALGIGHGDEVIVPDMTFVATATAVVWAGATPVLADVDERSLNLDPAAFERAITARTRAVIPVHVSGRPADMQAILAIAAARGIEVVEDAAEGLLSRYRGKCLGTLGKTGCVSFSPNKTITTGQGGAVFTDDDAVYARLVELKDQGRPVRGTGGDDTHPSIGFNLKFTNLQAAVGLAQLTQLDARVERMRAIYETYAERLKNLPGLRLPGFDLPAGEIPQWVDVVCEDRAGLQACLAEHGMGSRRFWHPLHTQKPFRRADDEFPVAAAIAAKCLWLPSAFTTEPVDIERVCERIRAFALAGV